MALVPRTDTLALTTPTTATLPVNYTSLHVVSIGNLVFFPVVGVPIGNQYSRSSLTLTFGFSFTPGLDTVFVAGFFEDGSGIPGTVTSAGQLPTGCLTFLEIVNLALRKAGNTNNTVREDAKTWLRQYLFELYSLYTWPFLKTEIALTINGTTIALPSDLLRPVDDHAWVITAINNSATRLFLREVDRETYERHKIENAIGVPTLFTVDRALGVALLWPGPGTSVMASTLRYYRLPPCELADTDIPTFPYHDFLVQAVYVRVLEYEFDSRASLEAAKREAMLQKICNAAHPLRSQADTLLLDPHVFGTPFYGDC